MAEEKKLDKLNPKYFEQKLLEKDISLTIEKLIGKGGQKQVYSAQMKDNSQSVVFKVMIPSGNMVERVKREVRATVLINHPNIPKILFHNLHDTLIQNDFVWIIEEFVAGDSLRALLKSGKTFNISEMVTFLNTMLSILSKSEQHSIVHRDIKPENIIVGKNGKFWLIDFGISRHLDLESITSSSSPIGPHTLGYSASEQFRNRKKDIDIRADFFSLGVVAAEMIIGQNPYLEGTHDALQLIKKIEQQPLPILRIEGDSQYFLARFIKTLGDNRPSRRPMNTDSAIRIFNLVKDSLK